MRLLAILEVVAVFAAMHVCYRAIKHFTVIGRWEREAGTNFTPGMVMIAFTFAIVWLGRKNLREYGLTLDRWRENISLGLACALVEMSCGAMGLMLSGYKFDASRPPNPYENPDWARFAVVAGFLFIGWIAALALAFSRRPIVRAIPAPVSIVLIGLLAAVPLLLAAYLGKPLAWATVLWLFFGAGFGEEIFYRGYVQSRVDEDWGRPLRLLGFEFGTGLLVSSLLFGLVHALNTVDYFHGRFDFGWRMGVNSIFFGAYYGLLRARTGSVLPGAIMHGLTDVFARIPNVLRL